jgi:hypothetical protein
MDSCTSWTIDRCFGLAFGQSKCIETDSRCRRKETVQIGDKESTRQAQEGESVPRHPCGCAHLDQDRHTHADQHVDAHRSTHQYPYPYTDRNFHGDCYRNRHSH